MRVAMYKLMLMAGLVLLLGGCKDTGRPTSYDKGTYGGKADQKLTPDQVKALRQRGAHQR